MPKRDIMNKQSATVSSLFSIRCFDVRIEKKENKQEIVSKIAIPEVSSSIILLSALSVK